MLTNEEREIMNKLKETAMKIDADLEAGRITKTEYWVKLRLVEEAEEKIKEISGETK